MDNGYKEEIAKLLKQTDDIDFQIRRYNYENQKLTATNDKEIEKLKEELTKVEFDLQNTLEKSGEDAIKPKCGWVHFRKLKDKLIFTEATIPEIEEKLPGRKDEFIKISKSLILVPLKNELLAGNIKLENYTIETQDPKFEYKYTGGNE